VIRPGPITLFTALLALDGGVLRAQEPRGRRLAGIVTDTTRNPIPGAEVGLIEGQVVTRSVRTGDDGRFELTSIPHRKTSIVVRRLGFQPRTYTIQIREGASRAFLRVVLDPMPAELEKVIVMARVTASGGRLKSFYERKARNPWGTFIDREELERRRPLWMSDVLRMIPGVRVIPTRYGNAIRVRDCAPTLWLDGMPLRGTEVDEVVAPSDVAGVEVYRSMAGMPVEFMDMRTNCGAIVVWTRVQ
jgi:hypothetical protein